MGADIVIRLLGPIDVLTPEGPRSVGGPHARALLGALALAGGRSVSIDHLCRAVWEDELPASAESSLQTYVWRLRRLLGHETLGAVDHSYRLDIGRRQIDALQFEDLLIEATDVRSDHQRCAELCRASLALWRGPPFGELGDEESFQLEALRLNELRLTAIELLLESEVALGHHEIAVAELECAVREHPYRERMWYLLIDALRLDDRRVEALRACRDLRRSLAEVGLEPQQDLETIESQILSEDSATRATEP